jgi:crotonobetainyl-CoA:carnitine CoA-transferase CaiB-like acyl-CoA transferase
VVDLSIYETAAGSIDRRMGQIVTYQYSGRMATREPNLGRGYPNAIWPCADGYFNVTGGPVFFPRIVQMMGMPELMERYGGVEAQSDPDLREEFESEVWLPWLLTKTKAELMQLGHEARVLCGVVATSEDLMQDPQFAARNYFVQVTHPEAGTLTMPGAPVKFSETPWELRRPAPLLGQHNDDILCGELGYARQDLALLRGQGVI